MSPSHHPYDASRCGRRTASAPTHSPPGVVDACWKAAIAALEKSASGRRLEFEMAVVILAPHKCRGIDGKFRIVRRRCH